MKKRIISLLLAVCLCAALLPTTALATSKTADDAIAWANSQVGHSVGYNDGSGYYQCVEFIQAYYQWLGVDKVSGNGADYATNALPSGWTRTAGGTPQKGDILIYSSYSATIQPYGHVAIYESDNALYDQDGSVYGATVKKEQKNYRTYTYNYWGCIHPDFTSVVSEPTVSFGSWENSNYTYIREKDAAIGQTINVSGGTCGENGMYLYDANGNFLASAKNPTYTLPQIYFQINAECGYTLTPGTTYKYKFYAVVDGEYYWSDWGTFKTTGTAPAANYSISLNRSSLSMTVGDEAALSATVSPAGPAVTWKSSNEAVAKVINGNVTAVKAGSVTITATAAGKTATCKVTVTAAATTPDPVPTPGSGSREQEPNDTIVTANPVSLNTAVTGNLYKTSDKDWFEFTLPSAGMVQLSFGHEYVDLDSDCWRTYLYTAENKEIVYFQWKGNATVTEQSGQIGLEAGTYYVCVTKTPAYRYDVDYHLTVNFTASNTWETEFNDTAATADPMALNTKYSGSIMNSRDEDWYAFTLPTSETVQLVFGNEPVTTFGNNWRTTIYTSEKKKVVSSTWRGDATTDQTSDECSLAAGTYYVCVEGMIGNRKDETYWITIKTATGTQSNVGDIVAPFTDVKVSAYYAEPVKWAVDHGVTVGTSATTFSPDATCTNAQILTFIWRAAGFPEPAVANPFTNLSGSEYYAKAAVWAYSMGMVSGTAFDANKACTRAMTMEYLWKQAGSPAVAASGKFTDVPSSAAYATAVAWAVNNGITAGTSNTTFSPDSICTRGQIMTFLYRAEG